MNRIILPLLTLGLSLGPILCWAAEPNADQAKAIAEIKRLGGKVTIDETSPGGPTIGVDLSRTKVTDTALENLKRLRGLRSLELKDTKVTDAGLKHLAGLIELRYLNLAGTKITDAGLKHLQGLTNLRDLNLSGTNVTNSGLKHLQGLRELHDLDLRRTWVSNDGVKKLHRALPKCNVMQSK